MKLSSFISSSEINPFKLLLKKKSDGSGSFVLVLIKLFLFFLSSSISSSILNEEK